MSATYTTAANFKSTFGIPSDFTSDDAFIDTQLETEEGLLQAELGYTFGEDTDRIDEWVAPIGRVIVPPKVPISSIDTLKIDNVTIGSDYYDISEDKFYIWLDDDYDYGNAPVEVYLKYTCGYDTDSFPVALKTVLYWRAGYDYAVCRTTVRNKSGGIKGKFAGIESLQDKAKMIVNKYKLYNLNPSGKIG
jgi:hypothetical protein